MKVKANNVKESYAQLLKLDYKIRECRNSIMPTLKTAIEQDYKIGDEYNKIV